MRLRDLLSVAVTGFALALVPASSARCACAQERGPAPLRLQGFPDRWAQELTDELRSAGLWVEDGGGPDLVLRLDLDRYRGSVCLEASEQPDDCIQVADDPTRRAVRRRLWIAVVERLRARLPDAGRTRAPDAGLAAAASVPDVDEDFGPDPPAGPGARASAFPASPPPAAMRFGVGTLLGVPEPDLGVAKHASFLGERDLGAWLGGWARLLWPLHHSLVHDSALGQTQSARLWSSALDAGLVFRHGTRSALGTQVRVGLGAHGLMHEGIRAEPRSQRAGARLHGALTGAVGLRLRVHPGVQLLIETEVRQRIGLVPARVTGRVADALSGVSGALGITLLFDVR